MARIPNAFSDDGFEIINSIPPRYVQLMEKPLCLLEFKGPESGIFIRHETCELLQQLDTPIVVVGVAGIYRSGKSYLMNLLAGKKTGFELGSTVESKTKGIWIWCRPHPTIKNTTLVLVDTEGLEDVNNGDDNRDMQIIVLTLLLSSTFIYNTVGRLDNGLIKQLGFVSELTKYIQVHAGQEIEDDSDFDLYFPVLVVTVRDFVLELKINNHSVTAEEYFEHCLKLKEDKKDNAKNSKKLNDYNEPRIKIRKYFPKTKRHCFVLPQPVKNFCQEWLARINVLTRDEMNPKFLTKCAEYQQLIIDISRKKTFGREGRVNGRMFVDMVEYYVTALQSGRMPCIQSALKLTADKENKRLLHESVSQYEEKMLALNFPLSLEELMFSHAEIVSDITKEFKAKLIFEESEDFRDEFQKNFEVAYNSIVRHNEECSRKKCEGLLKSLNEIIEGNILNKIYLCPGGYNIYVADINDLKNNYNGIIRKGVKSDEVLHEFLQGKESEINNIIAVDKEMTTVKIKEEAERRLREEIESREEMLQKEIIAARNREEKLQETFREITNEMQNELEKRLEEQRQEFQQTLADRQETYDQLSSELKQEIANLKDQLKPKPQRSSPGSCILF